MYAHIDVDAESTAPGGNVHGEIKTGIKSSAATQSMKLKIDQMQVYLLLRSENSKAAKIHCNKQSLILEQKFQDYIDGKKEFKINTFIPKDAFTTIDIDGFDYGEFTNHLYLKVVLDGTYAVPKKLPKASETPKTPGPDPKKDSTTQVHPVANPTSAGELFEIKKFSYVITEDIEVENDTAGHKVRLEKPVTRKFLTQTGGFCCKNDTSVDMDGFIYNPNLLNYGDEIKFLFKMKTNGKNQALKEIDIITSFGCVPLNDPRPDFMVWKPLSVYKFFPDPNLKFSDYDTSGNANYSEEVTLSKAQENHNSHFATNTEKTTNKDRFSFRFPLKGDSDLELFGKIKIGRNNGMSCFHSTNSVFKTMFAVKFIPVFKGSSANGSSLTKGKVGNHLTVPISVKANDQPTEADIRALQLMYEGKDQDHNVNKEKLGATNTTML